MLTVEEIFNRADLVFKEDTIFTIDDMKLAYASGALWGVAKMRQYAGQETENNSGDSQDD